METAQIALDILEQRCHDARFLKWYRSLIERRLTQPSDRGERHHILPRCMGGWNGENIVKLTAREHFVAHALLARAFPRNDKLSYAFWAMCNQSNKYHERKRPSSRLYERAKAARAVHISKLLTGRVFSDETRRKMSESAKHRRAQSPACLPGRAVSDETKRKLSELAKKRMENPPQRECPRCKRLVVCRSFIQHARACERRTLEPTAWTRQCPSCNAPISYARKNAYERAVKRDAKCRSCR